MTLTKQGHMVTLFCFQKMQNMLIYNQEKFQTPAKPLASQANQPHTGQIAHKPANYEKKISFLCYQKLQRYCKTCAKFATILRHCIKV